MLILTAENSQQIEKIYQYGNQAQATGNNITVNFTLDDTLKAPVYLYYGLNNFYQNHRRFIKFFSTGQMNGNEVDKNTVRIGLLIGSCRLWRSCTFKFRDRGNCKYHWSCT